MHAGGAAWPYGSDTSTPSWSLPCRGQGIYTWPGRAISVVFSSSFSNKAGERSTASSRVEEVGRMSSIEWEPKTLTLDQIKFAREAALYVVSTKTEEEAIRIFTEGLKPVEMNTVRKQSRSIDSSSDDDVDLGCSSSSGDSTKACCGGGSKGDRRGGRRRRHSIDDRDVATAPF